MEIIVQVITVVERVISHLIKNTLFSNNKIVGILTKEKAQFNHRHFMVWLVF